MAYIANGHRGFFSKQVNANELAQKLEQKGHVYRSQTDEKIGDYPVLSDNSSVHISEIMCHLIESYIERNIEPAEAMKKSFMDFPGEIVGLMIHTSEPNAIFASRISQPLMIGHGLNATYLSTTALAFPTDIHTISPMPVNSTAIVRSNLIKILPFDPPPAKVCTTIPWYSGYEKITNLIFDGEDDYYGLGSLKQATVSIWPEDLVSQKDMMIYEVLRCLYEEGKINFKYVEKCGALPELKTFQKVAYYMKK